MKVCNTHEAGVYRSAMNENKILKDLDNQYIVQMVAFHEDPLVNRTYLVAKHAGNKNIEQFVKENRVDPDHFFVEKPLSEALIRSIMTQLFETIRYLHSKRVCHRDLKPDNILIQSEGGKLNKNDQHVLNKSRNQRVCVKVIDFNVAVQLEGEEDKIKGGTGLKEWSAPETR